MGEAGHDVVSLDVSLPHMPLEHRHELLHQPGVVHPHAGADEVAVHGYAIIGFLAHEVTARIGGRF